MANNIGIAFQPGVSAAETGTARSGPPAQSIVKLMSLRLPSVASAQAPSPQAILAGGGGEGSLLAQDARKKADVVGALWARFVRPESISAPPSPRASTPQSGGGYSSAPSASSGVPLLPGVARPKTPGGGLPVSITYAPSSAPTPMGALVSPSASMSLSPSAADATENPGAPMDDPGASISMALQALAGRKPWLGGGEDF